MAKRLQDMTEQVLKTYLGDVAKATQYIVPDGDGQGGKAHFSVIIFDNPYQPFHTSNTLDALLSATALETEAATLRRQVAGLGPFDVNARLVTLDAQSLNAKLLLLRPQDRQRVLLAVMHGYCPTCGNFSTAKNPCACDIPKNLRDADAPSSV
jgi:hypothetical protein